MNLKKTLFTSVAAVALMSVSAEMVQQNTSNEVVQAAKKKSKKVTKKTLKRNAAIYNSKGKRVGKKTLKKGKKVKILGSKTIEGKKYYKIGSNKFVKQANFKKLVKKATKKATKKSTTKKKVTKKTTENTDDEEETALDKWADQYKDGVVVTATKDSTIYYGGIEKVQGMKVKKGTTLLLSSLVAYEPEDGLGSSFSLDVDTNIGETDIGEATVLIKDFTYTQPNAEEKGILKILDKTNKGYSLVAKQDTYKYKLSGETGYISEPLSSKKLVKKGKVIANFSDSSGDDGEGYTIQKVDGTWYFVEQYGEFAVKASDVKAVKIDDE